MELGEWGIGGDLRRESNLRLLYYLVESDITALILFDRKTNGIYSNEILDDHVL